MVSDCTDMFQKFFSVITARPDFTLDWPSYRGYIIKTYTSWVSQRDDLFGLIFDESLFYKYKMNNLGPLIVKQMKHVGSTLSNRGGSGSTGGSSFTGGNRFSGGSSFAGGSSFSGGSGYAGAWGRGHGVYSRAHIILSVGEAIPHSFHLPFTHTNHLLPPSNVISVCGTSLPQGPSRECKAVGAQ